MGFESFRNATRKALRATVYAALFTSNTSFVPPYYKDFVSVNITGEAPVKVSEQCSDIYTDSLQFWIPGVDSVLIPYKNHRDGGPVKPTPFLQDTTSLETLLARMDSVDADTARLANIKEIYSDSNNQELKNISERFNFPVEVQNVIVGARKMYDLRSQRADSDSGKILIARGILAGSPIAVHIEPNHPHNKHKEGLIMVNPASTHHSSFYATHEQVHHNEDNIRNNADIEEGNSNNPIFTEALATYLSAKEQIKSRNPLLSESEIAFIILRDYMGAATRPVSDTLTRAEYLNKTRYSIAPAILGGIEWRVGDEKEAIRKFAKYTPCF